jgi:uncharacterized circularly permuted ATP-grasp superfamily protein
MEINVAGLVVLFVFYVVILIVGILAACRKKTLPNTTAMESSIVAGRDMFAYMPFFATDRISGKKPICVRKYTYLEKNN